MCRRHRARAYEARTANGCRRREGCSTQVRSGETPRSTSEARQALRLNCVTTSGTASRCASSAVVQKPDERQTERRSRNLRSCWETIIYASR